MRGIRVCSSWRRWRISFSATLGSVRSSGEATLSRRRRKPPSPPAVVSVAHVVPAVVSMVVGGFPPAVLAVFGVFAEAVILAKMTSVSWLLLATVRWVDERAFLLVRTVPLVVLSVVEISKEVEFLVLATSERL